MPKGTLADAAWQNIIWRTGTNGKLKARFCSHSCAHSRGPPQRIRDKSQQPPVTCGVLCWMRFMPYVTLLPTLLNNPRCGSQLKIAVVRNRQSVAANIRKSGRLRQSTPPCPDEEGPPDAPARPTLIIQSGNSVGPAAHGAGPRSRSGTTLSLDDQGGQEQARGNGQ
jgi:hypothetical protein